MERDSVHSLLLPLLVRVYNQSIQSYYFFPDVILCGNHRLDREAFDLLLKKGCLYPYHTDSFGRLYRLTKKAEALLQTEAHRHKRRIRKTSRASVQPLLLFA